MLFGDFASILEHIETVRSIKSEEKPTVDKIVSATKNKSMFSRPSMSISSLNMGLAIKHTLKDLHKKSEKDSKFQS